MSVLSICKLFDEKSQRKKVQRKLVQKKTHPLTQLSLRLQVILQQADFVLKREARKD